MRIQAIITTTICGYFLSACSMDFNQPKILETYPANLSVGVSPDTAIRVRFSEEMDKPITEEAFRLASNADSVSGAFSWSGTTLHFTPSRPLKDGNVYELTITSKAEDSAGNNLQDSFSSSFTVGNDTVKPELLSYNPSHGSQGLPQNQTIVLTFSEPVSTVSLLEGVTISPVVTGDFTSDSTGKVITFTPHYNLDLSTNYTVTVTNAVTDLSGNALLNEESFTFTIGSDFVKPSVSSAQSGTAMFTNNLLASGVSRFAPVIILFSEVMSTSSILDSISISPTTLTSYSFATIGAPPNEQTQLTINFPQNLNSETEYTLSVPDSITDTSNNALDSTYTFKFKTDAPDSVRPKVLGIRQYLVNQGNCTVAPNPPCYRGTCGVGLGFCQGMRLKTVGPNITLPDAPAYLAQNDTINIQHHVDITPDPPAGPDTSDHRLVLVVYFDKPMNFSTLLNAVSLETIVSGPNNVNISSMELTGGNMELRVYFDGWFDSSTYQKITIQGGVAKDTNGNALLNDYILYLNS